MKKWTVATFQAAKGQTRLGCCTAYDACFARLADEAGVTLVVASELLAGRTPDASTCALFSCDAAFDTESYDNGLGIVPSFLLVPYSIDKDNLDLLIATGLYVMGDDGYLAAP